MGLSRRALIKQAGMAIAALGLTDLAMEVTLKTQRAQAQAYGQALAAGTQRKLALLIGIDKYAEGAVASGQTGQLAGCVADITMQKELLIHRFGFLPEDIISLTNQQATRDGIYQAFETHLYNQAKPGDTVVLHFSGYGAQVRIDEDTALQKTEKGATRAQAVRSLVPYDGVLPTPARPALNDISEAELKTLLKQLKTKNITTVLDVGYVDITVPLSGGLRSRSRATIATGRPAAPFPLLQNRRLAAESDEFPGILLRAADLNDTVIERQWNGFSAGAFTYVLTQSLWTIPAPSTLDQMLGHAQETLLRWGGSNQQPVLDGSDQSQLQKLSMYGTPTVAGSRGEGVVKAISDDGKTATLWLGGLPPRVLEYLDAPSVLTCMGRRLKVRSHDGITGRARLIEDAGNNGAPLQVGQPVFETIRVLPRTIDLVVALDSQLERIERVDATSALSALPFVSSTSDTELPADCLLSKATPEKTETLTASLQPGRMAQTSKTSPEQETAPAEAGAGYGLFSLTRSLIPGTLAMQDEAIKPAISRLTEKLRSLTALKMLRLTENRASSLLSVRVILETVDSAEKQLIYRQTLRPAPLENSQDKNNRFVPKLPVGSRVRYRVFNDSNQPLFYTLINVDPRERLSAFCPVVGLPAQPAQSAEAIVSEEANSLIAAASIAPGGSVAVPSADLDWSVEAPTGPVETYVVCSTSPLTNTFNTLLSAAATSGQQRVRPLPNPLEVVTALLSDIDQSRDDDAYRLDVAQWATLNFTYQAV